jgi:hypothetical protein
MTMRDGEITLKVYFDPPRVIINDYHIDVYLDMVNDNKRVGNTRMLNLGNNKALVVMSGGAFITNTVVSELKSMSLYCKTYLDDKELFARSISPDGEHLTVSYSPHIVYHSSGRNTIIDKKIIDWSTIHHLELENGKLSRYDGPAFQFCGLKVFAVNGIITHWNDS